jgi:uncharacterized membrane protein YgdD (TMEM256/DUF423 family)
MRWLLVLSAFSGFLAVALGAVGAHGLKSRLASHPEAARRLEWWQTAASYHLAHALAIGLTGVIADIGPGSVSSSATARLPCYAGWAFAIGTLLFSGSLYVMALTGLRKLGAVTPLGGLGLLAGWGCLLAAALRF